MMLKCENHEPEEHMNIYEVPLTIKVNPMWYFISGMLIRGKYLQGLF